ncbi:hypothetical protein [Streptomyces sp. NPDC040750]|uniref:hypothetical protein n=1 Tax=Streptomyces sp. NPDC040750 TaxID=3154491 RepID=UPI0033C2DF36
MDDVGESYAGVVSAINANLDTLDPGIDPDIVTKAARPCRIDTVLSTSLGFGGQNAVLVLQGP